MATNTTNYELVKPDATDAINIAVLNANFDIIDTQMKENEDAVPAVATSLVAGIVKPDNTTILVDPDGTIHGAQTYVLPAATASRLGGVKIGSNLTVGDDGTINAWAQVITDNAPTAGSNNVPKSGGTYTAINTVAQRVDGLASQVTALTTGVTWKPAVATFNDLATTYPVPAVGWTANCLDTGNTYQWNGTWQVIFASVVPVASIADVQSVLEA